MTFEKKVIIICIYIRLCIVDSLNSELLDRFKRREKRGRLCLVWSNHRRLLQMETSTTKQQRRPPELCGIERRRQWNIHGRQLGRWTLLPRVTIHVQDASGLHSTTTLITKEQGWQKRLQSLPPHSLPLAVLCKIDNNAPWHTLKVPLFGNKIVPLSVFVVNKCPSSCYWKHVHLWKIK